MGHWANIRYRRALSDVTNICKQTTVDQQKCAWSISKSTKIQLFTQHSSKRWYCDCFHKAHLFLVIYLAWHEMQFSWKFLEEKCQKWAQKLIEFCVFLECKQRRNCATKLKTLARANYCSMWFLPEASKD